MLFKVEKPLESATKRVITYVAVFLSAAAAYAFIEAAPMFRDPDSFYHLKMAMLIRDQGIVRAFPWLPFTTLANNYADHHLLYHLLLVPFVTAFGPFIGMAVATVFFAAAAIAAFHALLRAYRVRHAWVYTFILGSSAAFSFRINLAKTSALSLTLLFAALIAMRKDKPAALFAISWLFVMLYGGWPLMGVLAAAFLAARGVADRLFEKHPYGSWAAVVFWKRLAGGSRRAWTEFAAAKEARQAAAVAAGLACGIVINPYFPANIRFYWDQIIQIAVIGYRDAIGVGGEWYPYAFDRLLADSSAIFLLALLGVAVLAFALFWPDTVRRGRGWVRRSEATPIAAVLALAVLFLAMTLRSKRHVEYFAPFAVFVLALVVDAVISRLDHRAAAARLKELLPKPRVTVPMAMACLPLLFLFLGARDVYLVAGLYRQGVPWTIYAGAASWLSAHAPEGAIVFHSNWDEFPPLFFRDDRVRYVAGLDPTFLYLRDPVRYRLWTDVTLGKVQRGAAALVRRDFGAKYVFVAKGYEDMRRAFASDKGAVSVYKDGDAEIFLIL